MDDQQFESFLEGTLVLMSTGTHQDRVLSARRLYRQAHVYMTYASAALIGEHGVLPRNFFWEPEMGKTAVYYANRAQKLTNVALGVIAKIKEN